MKRRAQVDTKGLKVAFEVLAGVARCLVRVAQVSVLIVFS